MEMTLKMGAFEVLGHQEMMIVDGGGVIGDALLITGGAVLVAFSPVVAIGGTIVGTPLGGGVVAAGMAGYGLQMIGKGTHH